MDVCVNATYAHCLFSARMELKTKKERGKVVAAKDEGSVVDAKCTWYSIQETMDHQLR